MTVKSKILFISNYQHNIGGISIQVDQLRNCLNKVNCKSSIFTTKGSLFKRLVVFGTLPFKGYGYTTFHIHCCSNWGGMVPALFGLFWGKILRKRVLITYHGGDAATFLSKYPCFLKFWFTHADQVIVLSPFFQDIFSKYGIPTIVIPNVLNEPLPTRRECKISSLSFICTRHLNALYNIKLIIEAFKKVNHLYPQSQLFLAGDGVERESLELYVREKDIKNISFLGQLDNKAVYLQLLNSSFFISASHVDNMPVSILEAMACGTIVLASAVGGVPSMIENGKNGLLFNDNDEEGLVNCMLKVITNEKLCSTMRIQGYEALEQYRWKNVKSILLPLYE